MIKLLYNPAQIVSVNTKGKNYKRGKDLNDVGVLFDSSVIIENGTIKDIIPSASAKRFNEKIDLSGKTLLPGLIDCHTHTVFAGSRAGEFRKKLAGASYEEIAKEGGGINTTVTAVQKLSIDELVKIASPRIDNFISQGITALEIKSGYGLSFIDEIKILRVIADLNQKYSIDIVPTFLGAHTYPPEFKKDHKGYIKKITEEMLPFISDNKLAVFCDAFCETTAFSPDEIEEIFNKAAELGFKIKLHTDQFNSIGGLDLAIKHKAVSADHLEVLKEEDMSKLGKEDITAVLLPGVSFFLNYGFAQARKLIDSNAIVAISTDYNPGSSNISSLHFIMSLAALGMKMTIEETISAVTINAAKALGISEEQGSIELGKKADFAVFDTVDYTDIIYNIGNNLNYMTIKNGNIIYKK